MPELPFTADLETIEKLTGLPPGEPRYAVESLVRNFDPICLPSHDFRIISG